MFQPVEFATAERLAVREFVLRAVEGFLVFARYATSALQHGGETVGVSEAVIGADVIPLEGAVEALAGFAVAVAVDEVEDEADEDGDGEDQLEVGHEGTQYLLQIVHVCFLVSYCCYRL